GRAPDGGDRRARQPGRHPLPPDLEGGAARVGRAARRRLADAPRQGNPRPARPVQPRTLCRWNLTAACGLAFPLSRKRFSYRCLLPTPPELPSRSSPPPPRAAPPSITSCSSTASTADSALLPVRRTSSWAPRWTARAAAYT